MTYLEQLLEGKEVAWKQLGEVCAFRNGFAFQRGKYQSSGLPIIRITDIQHTRVLIGEAFFNSDDYTDDLSVYEVKKGDILIALSGATTGKIGVVEFEEKAYINQRVGKFLPKEEVLNTRYLFHYLLSKRHIIHQMAWGGAQENLSSVRLLKEFFIPLPPLAVQEKIVEILDKYSALETELEKELAAELELRKKQYEYYRNKLMRFGKEVEWKPLGEVAELKRGTSITQNTSTEGGYPVISGGRQPAYYVDQFNRTGETITVAGSGAYAGFLQYWNEPIFVGDAFSIKPDPSLLLTRFVYFFLLKQQQKLHDMKVGGAVPHVYTKFVAPLLIPLPPLTVQEQIVAILDKFHTLVHSISEGLTAELSLRRRQYEYYRNLLLRFPPPAALRRTRIKNTV